jgi:serine/threonine-protein kinase RsbW
MTNGLADLPQMSVIVNSRLDCVATAGILARTFCECAGVCPLESTKIEVCIVEAINNCIIHAYNLLPDNVVELRISNSSSALIFEIYDRGNGMDPGQLRVFSRDPHDLDSNTGLKDMPENGRGLYIIQSLMDAVEYSSLNNNNCLTMTKHFRRPMRKPG